MNTDKITTWLGLGQAIVVAAITFYTTASAEGSVDLANPVFWAGLVAAAFMAVKGYYTNKATLPKV